MIGKDDPNRKEYVNQVIDRINKKGINYVRLNFTDIHGIIKSFAVRTKDLERYFEDGAFFDGSSVTGYGSIEESDMIAVPDPTTFQIIPWRTEETGVCRLICDIYNPDGSRYAGDPRYILQKTLDKAREKGFDFHCAPELEFFILKQDGDLAAKPSDLRGYFDWDPSEFNETMRRQMADYCLKMGIDIEVLHHEVATGQHEIDFRYGPAIDTADNAITIKMIVKVVAALNDAIGTFMPKPFFGVNGSGMHVHQSLWKDGNNVFYDANDPHKISKIMKQFIAGQLKYAPDMTAVLASWPNSYKRLVPGYEAPVYIAWGLINRSSLIRVPNFGNKANAARCEIRCPDPAGNPYLQFAVLLATGLQGIIEELEAPSPMDMNVYKLNTKEMKKKGLKSIPGSLGVALEYFENSNLMKETFCEKPFKNYLYAKLEEWDEYRKQVHGWELTRYMDKL
ncbi:MAG: glutamine synthetase [Candidatus Lokiarchaeota archaeon]|nr:glutamine synthetase [Candidatus Lokiarchaeota archaeon]